MIKDFYTMVNKKGTGKNKQEYNQALINIVKAELDIHSPKSRKVINLFLIKNELFVKGFALKFSTSGGVFDSYMFDDLCNIIRTSIYKAIDSYDINKGIMFLSWWSFVIHGVISRWLSYERDMLPFRLVVGGRKKNNVNLAVSIEAEIKKEVLKLKSFAGGVGVGAVGVGVGGFDSGKQIRERVRVLKDDLKGLRSLYVAELEKGREALETILSGVAGAGAGAGGGGGDIIRGCVVCDYTLGIGVSADVGFRGFTGGLRDYLKGLCKDEGKVVFGRTGQANNVYNDVEMKVLILSFENQFDGEIIGAMLGMSRQRVHQILAKSLKKTMLMLNLKKKRHLVHKVSG